MKLLDQFTDYIHAAFTGLWVQTHEPDEAEREIVRRAHEQHWKFAVWDLANGLRLRGVPGGGNAEAGMGDPLAALRALPGLAERDGTALLLLQHFHRFLNNPEVMQTLFAQLAAGKRQRTLVVVLSAMVQIPVELEKLFVVVEHALPDREHLEGIARELTDNGAAGVPQGDELQRVLDAAAGLTRYEAEAAFALSLTRHNVVRPEAVWQLKAQTLTCSRCSGAASVSFRWAASPALRSFAAGRCGPAAPSGRAACCCSAFAARARALSPARKATRRDGRRWYSTLAP